MDSPPAAVGQLVDHAEEEIRVDLPPPLLDGHILGKLALRLPELLVLPDKGLPAAELLRDLEIQVRREDHIGGTAHEEQQEQKKQEAAGQPKPEIFLLPSLLHIDGLLLPGHGGLHPGRPVALPEGQGGVPDLFSRPQLHQGLGVLPAVLGGELLQSEPVAVHLQVQAGVLIGQPDQGIPPVEDQSAGDDDLHPGVLPLQVVELVAEDHTHPLRGQLLLEVDHVVLDPVKFFRLLVYKAGGQPLAQTDQDVVARRPQAVKGFQLRPVPVQQPTLAGLGFDSLAPAAKIQGQEDNAPQKNCPGQGYHPRLQSDRQVSPAGEGQVDLLLPLAVGEVGGHSVKGEVLHGPGGDQVPEGDREHMGPGENLVPLRYIGGEPGGHPQQQPLPGGQDPLQQGAQQQKRPAGEAHSQPQIQIAGQKQPQELIQHNDTSRFFLKCSAQTADSD